MVEIYCFQNKIDAIQWGNMLRAINKRHAYDFDWLYEKRNWDGTTISYLSAECVEWIDTVYFRNEKNYIDAEISFSISKLKKYFPEKDSECFLNYEDKKVMELSNYFSTHKANIYKAIKKLPVGLIKMENNKMIVMVEGVKFLEQEIFKRKYWNRLEELRLCLKEKSKEKKDCL